MKTIVIAKEFTPYPGGRLRVSGKGSGEQFRQEFLIPAIETEEVTEFLLDGASGYPASFLEEAFGGLLRIGYSKEQVNRFIKISASGPYEPYKLLIEEYLSDAESRVKKH